MKINLTTLKSQGFNQALKVLMSDASLSIGERWLLADLKKEISDILKKAMDLESGLIERFTPFLKPGLKADQGISFDMVTNPDEFQVAYKELYSSEFEIKWEKPLPLGETKLTAEQMFLLREIGVICQKL